MGNITNYIPKQKDTRQCYAAGMFALYYYPMQVLQLILSTWNAMVVSA